MRIEPFYSPGRQRCADARGKLKVAAEDVPGVIWSELNVRGALRKHANEAF